MPSAIRIRDVEGFAETRLVEELQRDVWGMSERDITPLTHLIAVKEAGGQLIGAFDGDALIGVVYGFAGIHHGEAVHHSHLLAVRPAYRNLDIGYRLKLAQRDAALAQGIRRITWTFDPLQSANAHFNFRKLGATSDSYRVDFYGVESSSFLHRFGTDRLLLSWELESPRVLSRLRTGSGPEPRETAVPSLLRCGADGAPGELDLGSALGAAEAAIEIPGNFNDLVSRQPEDALRWREATRRAFIAAFDAGLRVDGFHRLAGDEQSAGVYELRHSRKREERG